MGAVHVEHITLETRTGSLKYPLPMRVGRSTILLSTMLWATATAAPGLLPEGSVITGVEGTMVRPTPDDPWHLRITTDGDTRELVLMPCRVLEEMEDAGDAHTFVITGTVSVFDERNWLMPGHAEVTAEHAVRNESKTAPANPGDEDDADITTQSAGDSVADIVAELQQSVGPLRRSLDTGVEKDTDADIQPDGTLIVSRRGRMMRGRHGAWVFVFDSDAWGTADAPVVLLPSPLLKSLIASGQRTDFRGALNLSGTLTTYRGRRFLVPTAVTALRDRPNLSR